MRLRRIVRALALSSALAFLPSPEAMAEDTKGKWQFGFGLSYFATTDYIRSNSDIALAGGVVGENGLPPVTSVDERPDVNVLNEPSVRDDFRLDLNASYGLTRWLAVELAASYLKAPVGNIEYFTRDQTKNVTGGGSQSGARNCGPDQGQVCWNYNTSGLPSFERTNSFVPVGEITEVPVQLSALVRFRPESPLDPYVGLGVGYIKADLKTGAEFQDVSDTIGSLFVVSGEKGDFTREGQRSSNCETDGDGIRDDPCTQFTPSAPSAKVRDAFEWHAVGGIDYYVSERFSWYMDARYVWTNGVVDIRTDGDYQVLFSVIDEGQLILKHVGGCPASDPGCKSLEDPSLYSREEDLKYIMSKPCPTCRGTEGMEYFLWEDTGVQGCDTCPVFSQGDRYYATEDKFGGFVCTGGTNPGATCTGPADLTSCGGDGVCGQGRPKQNRTLEPAEDDGVLYILPPGIFRLPDLGEAKVTMMCADCANNERLDTEDKNGNAFMDTYLLYGEDECTTDNWVNNPKCTRRTSPSVNYVFPTGCAQSLDRVGPLQPDLKTLSNVGCPALPSANAGQAETQSSSDDAADVFLLQGGGIRLGGFSLGVGVKFTF